MSWASIYPILDQVSTLASLPLAVVGFGVTYYQAREAKRSADAAKEAVESTQRQLSRSSLLVLLPQLQRVESELERAIGRTERELAGYWLGQWRSMVGEAKAHLVRTGNTNEEMFSKIDKSIEVSGDAKNALIGTATDLRRVTLKALKSITIVTAEIGAMSASNATDVDVPPSEGAT